jgi:hypothetical protein
MSNRKALLPIIILFSAVSLSSVALVGPLESAGFEPRTLLLGNIFLFLLSTASIRLLANAMRASTTAGFLRFFYGSFMLKFLLVAAAAFAYIAKYRENINKPSLFSCMFLFLLYLALETRAVLSSAKKKEDGKE